MREALYHYNQQIIKLIGFSMIIGIPLLFVLFNANFYIMGLDLGGQENILLLFSYIMMFVLLTKPLHYLYSCSEQDEEVTLKAIIKVFIDSFGPIFIITVVTMVFVYLGIGLFLLPGIILFPFIFLFAFTYERELTLKQWIRNTLTLHNKYLITIWTQILLWACFLYLLWTGVLYFISYFEMTPIAFAILRILFSLIVFPYVVFSISDILNGLSKEEEIV